MSVALLDVNVLVALFDQTHIHHKIAHDWLEAHGNRPWATCPITIHGCVRILSRARTVPLVPADIAARLREFCERPSHTFWPDDLSLLDETKFQMTKFAGSRQITDIYLLALAVSRKGYLVTLDRSIPWQAAIGAIGADLRVIGQSA